MNQYTAVLSPLFLQLSALKNRLIRENRHDLVTVPSPPTPDKDGTLLPPSILDKANICQNFLAEVTAEALRMPAVIHGFDHSANDEFTYWKVTHKGCPVCILLRKVVRQKTPRKKCLNRSLWLGTFYTCADHSKHCMRKKLLFHLSPWFWFCSHIFRLSYHISDRGLPFPNDILGSPEGLLFISGHCWHRKPKSTAHFLETYIQFLLSLNFRTFYSVFPFSGDLLVEALATSEVVKMQAKHQCLPCLSPGNPQSEQVKDKLTGNKNIQKIIW